MNNNIPIMTPHIAAIDIFQFKVAQFGSLAWYKNATFTANKTDFDNNTLSKVEYNVNADESPKGGTKHTTQDTRHG